MAHLSTFDNATLLDVYRRYPSLAKPIRELAEAAFALTDEVSRAEGELLGTFVSQLNSCDYCRNVHAEAAAACGITPPQTSRFDYGGARWEPVFDYVHTLTLSPRSITTGHVTALLEAEWSEDAMTQFAALSCVFNTLNRLVDGLGLQADEDFFASAGTRLAQIGYSGTAERLGLSD